MALKKYTIDWVVENYKDYFQQFQLTEEKVKSHFETWKEGKNVVLVKDYLWYLFQQIVKTIAEQSKSEEQLYRMNVEVYKKMWEFLVKVENRNGTHILRQKLFNELNLWKVTAKYKQHVEIISGHCCPFCDSLDKKIMTIDEALETQPLASKQCTRKWGCNCCYSSTFARDERGNLIALN